MLHNRFAGDALKKVDILYQAGIEMNGQIVLCKGFNDGEELERSIRDLTKYLPFLRSVSVVPVGLRKYRDGLEGDDKERVMSMATGRLAYPYLLRLVQAMKDKFPNVHVNVVPIRNDFFGELITVSGLITGQDLMNQMKEQMQGERLLIPCNMLRIDEDVFLDDYTTDDVEKTLQVKLNIVKSSGQDLLDAILEK